MAVKKSSTTPKNWQNVWKTKKYIKHTSRLVRTGETLWKPKNSKKPGSSEGGPGKSPRILFFVFLCFFSQGVFFLVFSGRFFLFFLVLLRVLFFPKGGRPYFQLSGGGGPVCVCFQSRECHQRNRTILHLFLFQGNLHKGTPHCPQGTQSSLKAQLLIEEYLFKITLDFFQGLLFLFKWPFHGAMLHFLTEASPFFEDIHIHIYMSGQIITTALRPHWNHG